MSLAQKLIVQPQREKGGSLAQERFDYQAFWGLALIFSNHSGEEDYAIAFEFHDDILMIDSSTKPAVVKLYQVKTKDRGHWTLTDLFRRPPSKGIKKGEDRPLSHIGKLFSGYAAFPSETAQMSFVSNAPLEFAPANSGICFKDCDPEIFSKFLQHLKKEHSTASIEQASLINFVKADLSLDDAATHTKGKLHNFIVHFLGEISYNLDGLYRAIFEDCRTRSKYTGTINSFEDLMRYKAVTRADVEGWIETLKNQTSLPDWPEISSDLQVGAIQKTRLRAEWLKYRAQVLDTSDEAIRSVRREIKMELRRVVDVELDLIGFRDRILPLVKPIATAHLTPYSDEKLTVMIFYEVLLYGQTGKF